MDPLLPKRVFRILPNPLRKQLERVGFAWDLIVHEVQVIGLRLAEEAVTYSQSRHACFQLFVDWLLWSLRSLIGDGKRLNLILWIC
jgi:hypothetical protein